MKHLFLIGAFLVSAVAVKAQTLAEVINADGTLLVDVRSADEFAKGSVDGLSTYLGASREADSEV